MMTRQERLAYIARQLYDAKTAEKDAKSNVSEFRDEFFRLHDEEFKNKDFLLPIKTVEVPEEFFTRTGLSKQEFVDSRFPGWQIQHCEYNSATGNTVFVFRKDTKFMPGVIDIEDDDGATIRVAKEISEFTPDIDWETLKNERPDLYDKLARPVLTYEINEEEFNRLVAEQPEELATLQRHMTVRNPVLRVTARKVKNND